jgi:alcohol dehydrogenase class IV
MRATPTLPDSLLLPSTTLRGKDRASVLLPESAVFGPNGLLVHGRSLRESGILASILGRTPPSLRVTSWEHAGGEPTLDRLDALRKRCGELGVDWVAAVGGGSVLDLAKAAAGLLHAEGPAQAYHDGGAIPPSRTPFLAVPTTAGTGSEATAVSVLTNANTGVKKSIRHPSFLARVVILDPRLLASCPPAVAAASGMDALTQAVESFVSNHASWFSDEWALQAVRLIADSLETVCVNPADEKAADLLDGSYLAGIALSHARLGVVHGIAHPLGARYHVPHGVACAVCLPHAVELNRPWMAEKYDTLTRILQEDLLARIRRLLVSLKIPSPFTGRKLADKDRIVKETLESGSTAANPKPIAAADIEWLLTRLFGGRTW